VSGEELQVGPSLLEQPADHRQRQRQVGAGARREMEVGALGERRAARVDGHQPGTARLLHPEVRRGRKGDGVFTRVSWDEALSLLAEKLRVARAKAREGVGVRKVGFQDGAQWPWSIPSTSRRRP